MDTIVSRDEVQRGLRQPTEPYSRIGFGEAALLTGHEAALRYIELLTGSPLTPVCFRLVYDANNEEKSEAGGAG